MDTNAKWITTEKFASLLPLDIYSKENDKIEKNYDKDLLNSHVLFRRKFFANSADKYVIHISADDYYKLYINGHFVCSGPAPCYPWHYYFNEIDITKYIKDGDNTIAVHTYYQGLINRTWVSADRQHGMICTVYENNNVLLVSDESFKCSYHTGYNVTKIGVKHDTYFCEKVSSNSSEYGFEQEDYDDTNWKSSSIRQNCDYTLFKQEAKTLDYYRIKPQTVTEIENGYRIDIGREICGYVTAKASSVNGDTVTVRYAEELNDDGSVRYMMRCYCCYEDEWEVKGKNNTLDIFDYKGFRYVELLTNGDAVIDKDSIEIIVRHYPYNDAITCPVDDTEIKRVWQLCRDTIKYGTQECFVDCPTREKGQYLGDVSISAVANAILTGKTDMLKKSIQNFADTNRICKGLMAVSTSSLMQEIADFSLLFPVTLLWYHKLSGDTGFLKEMLPVVNELEKYFSKYEREDGLIISVTDKWNLVDWPENLRDNYDFPLTRPVGNGCHNVINAFYIGMKKCANKIRLLCKEPVQDISAYEKAYIKEFYNKEKHIFTDCNQTDHASIHSNVLPLFFNIEMDDETKNNVIDLIRSKGVTSSGTYFSFFILQSLKNAGEKELILSLIKDKKAWLNMLSEGATTTYEAWGKDQKKNTSLCHPWSVSPILILFDM